jgi:hypothetical protein
MGDISETNGKPHGHVNGYIVVPKWFVSFLSFVTSVVFVGAVLWAWSISNDVSAIKAELNAANEFRSAEMDNLRRRLDRHDMLFDRVLERLSPLEK